MALGEEDVYCTLVMSDSYLPGAAVLAHSLRDNGTKHKLACLVTLDSIRPSTFTELKSLFDYVIPVDRVGTPSPSNLYLMNRGDLLYTFTKIGLWRQTQFRRIVYIDADVVTLRAPDELFDLPGSFAAAPDVGWPDIFNTGVMVLTPNMGEYWALRTLAASGDSFDGADQGLLNQFYEHKDWHRLSFTYNCTPSANYQYEPAYRYYKSRISMVHFIGKEKPWMTTRSKTAAASAFNELLHRWWAVYDAHLQLPVMDYISGRSAPASTKPDPSGTINVEPEALVTTTEPDLGDTIDLSEELTKRTVEQTNEGEQKVFEAPTMGWDATRSAPPSDAQPEAANLPHESYQFNEDKSLFQAPKHYPEPPKDMWYEVPKEKPAYVEARPPPIFPWEQRDVVPTRVFADDVLSPVQTPVNETFDSESSLPTTPSIRITAEEPLAEYESSNAWDQEPGIDRYIRALHRRNKSSKSGNATSPPSTDTSTPFERRESLVLTDFPSEIERPSLPVTPAPMRRAFWGEERDAAGKLPSAEGVPNQADWNPSEKLEELRRHSLILTQSDLQTSKSIPDREMMPTAVEVRNAPSSAKEEPPKRIFTNSSEWVAAPRPLRAPRVQFAEVDFNGGRKDGESEKVLLPSQGGPEDEDAFLGE